MKQPIYDPDVKTVKVRQAVPDEPDPTRNVEAKLRRRLALAAAAAAATLLLSSCGHGCSVGCWWPGC